MTDSWLIPTAKSTRDLVFDMLRDRILSGELRHGEKLSEVPLAERLGVSRTPLREALARLTAAGYLQPAESTGLVVVDPFQNLDELIIRRAALDAVAAHLAARRASDAQLAALMAITEQYRRTDPLDLAERRGLNHRFHAAITTAANSHQVAREAEHFQLFFASDRLMQALTPDETEGAIRDHMLIAEAIRARDPFEAERLAREHIYGAYRRYLSPE
ncbi:GntR family transcriptional regulator [Haematobacter genomosp. 1]|uniref:HTH gntR-type domain-containing protein n=1 Tax=Haematobacter genomosp. 1 TaxID=366618 RepID=A0A212AAH5_9RHOB|nr:GntR family transcriptional regulator [Haematobacter genomosp. 1]OWJ77147.1 hypothetical protein CDV49_12065 [Haematobacter genomosp. 1]